MADGPQSERLEVLRQRWEQDRSSRIFLQLAEEYRRLDRAAEAIPVLEEGLRHHPGSLSALVALARAQLETGEAAAAIPTLEQVLAKDRTQMVAYRLLVEAYVDQAQVQLAEERLAVYAELNPTDPAIGTLRAQIAALASAPTLDPVTPAESTPARRMEDVTDRPAEPPASRDEYRPADLPQSEDRRPAPRQEEPSIDARQVFPFLGPPGGAVNLAQLSRRHLLAPEGAPAARLIRESGPPPAPVAPPPPVASPTEELPDTTSLEDETPAALSAAGSPQAVESATARLSELETTTEPGVEAAAEPEVEAAAEPEPVPASPSPRVSRDIFDLPPLAGLEAEEPRPLTAELPPAAAVRSAARTEELPPIEEVTAAGDGGERSTAGDGSFQGGVSPQGDSTESELFGEIAAAEGAEKQESTATLGSLYLKQGHSREAKAIFEQVLESEPGNESAKAGLVTALRQLQPVGDLLTSLDVPEHGGVSDRKARALMAYLARIRSTTGTDVR